MKKDLNQKGDYTSAFVDVPKKLDKIFRFVCKNNRMIQDSQIDNLDNGKGYLKHIVKQKMIYSISR